MSRELVPYKEKVDQRDRVEPVPFSIMNVQGDEKQDERQIVSADVSTLVLFSKAASDGVIENILASDNEKAYELVSNLQTIHSQIIGLEPNQIRELFAGYRKQAIVLFKDDPESRAAVLKLIGLGSQLTYYLHMQERQISVSEVREEHLLRTAEAPVQVIQQQRQTFAIEATISAALSGGIAYLTKDLVDQGLSVGRSMSGYLSDPLGYCTSATLVEDKGWFSTSQKTVVVRDAGYVCDALNFFSGGVNKALDFTSTTAGLASFIEFIMVFILLLTIFRILRSRVSGWGFRFEGALGGDHLGDDLEREIDELVEDRFAQEEEESQFFGVSHRRHHRHHEEHDDHHHLHNHSPHRRIRRSPRHHILHSPRRRVHQRSPVVHRFRTVYHRPDEPVAHTPSYSSHSSALSEDDF